MSTPSRVFVPLACASLLAACYTGVAKTPGAADGGVTPNDAEDTGESADDGDESDSGTDDTGPEIEESQCRGFTSGLRRLNLREYEHALQALLGDAVAVGEGFPADDTASGFDVDAGLLPPSGVWLTAHASLAESAVAAALADGAPTRDEILVCSPASPAEHAACAEQIVEAFGRRAWRRPLDEEEIASLVQLLDVAASEGGTFEDGVVLALQAILLSPNFVFKIEAAREPGEAVDPYELATRLAFFLWSGPPDEALLAAAEAGELDDEAGVRAQVQRMLADPRASALTDGFATQWLMLDELHALTPLSDAFPTWNEALRESMIAETRLSFAEALADDASVGGLLVSPVVLVDGTLAAHYGIEGVTGDAFERVDASEAQRFGLLTQGAILALTSHADQSSPTRRGLWVTDRLLCMSPPAPPADVDNTLPEPGADADAQTIREFLEETHLGDAACAGCHRFIDPVGFALEHYDAVGAFRTEYANGAAIDDSGELVGQPVDGAAELSAAIAAHPALQPCVTSWAVAYATNRARTDDDACIVEERFEEGEEVGLQTLLETIATHPSFAAVAAPEEP